MQHVAIDKVQYIHCAQLYSLKVPTNETNIIGLPNPCRDSEGLLWLVYLGKWSVTTTNKNHQLIIFYTVLNPSVCCPCTRAAMKNKLQAKTFYLATCEVRVSIRLACCWPDCFLFNVHHAVWSSWLTSILFNEVGRPILTKGVPPTMQLHQQNKHCIHRGAAGKDPSAASVGVLRSTPAI